MKKTKIIYPQKYISTNEASQLYDYSQRQLRRLCTKRKILAMKQANLWFVNEASLKRFIDF